MAHSGAQAGMMQATQLGRLQRHGFVRVIQ